MGAVCVGISIGFMVFGSFLLDLVQCLARNPLVDSIAARIVTRRISEELEFNQGPTTMLMQLWCVDNVLCLLDMGSMGLAARRQGACLRCMLVA